MFGMIRKLTNRRGTSLIEVMISLAIVGVVTTAIFKLYITQQKNYIVQDDVATVQQNARASLNEITRYVRMAGFDLPHGLDAIVASDTDPDTITVNFRSDDCDTYLSAAMPQPSAELKCGSDVSCFYAGQWVYIFEPDSGGGEWFEITQVQEASLHIQHNTMTLSKKYSKDAILLSMDQMKFYVDYGTDPEHPSLMVQLAGEDPQVFAEDITDLQFQYRMKNGMVFDEPPVAEEVREVIFSVTGRSFHEDYTTDEEGDFREREYATSVYLRNVGI
jgi:prepilin-type N-terminal cleavage/methylation domain-containing protein